MSHTDVKFEDELSNHTINEIRQLSERWQNRRYENDTRELAENAAAIITDLRRQLRDCEILMWAMVRAAGGSVLVRGIDISMGYPAAWKIEEDAATDGRRFTILPKADPR